MTKPYLLIASFCLLLTACGKQEGGDPTASTVLPSAPIKIDSLGPSTTLEAKGFNVQPDGLSAISVAGANIPVGSTVLWNEQPLATSGGGSIGWVAASVPANLYASPGTAKVVVKGPDGKTLSNALDFTIFAKSGPAPEVNSVNPDTAVAGKGFNVQPTGDSAFTLLGTGFIPTATIYFDGKPMKTVFTSETIISAAVPASMAAKPGSPQVWVVNPDGKSSKKLVFKITK